MSGASCLRSLCRRRFPSPRLLFALFPPALPPVRTTLRPLPCAHRPGPPLQLGFDVFNALDLMDNITFLDKQLFGKGDGHLQYYLYNYRLKAFPPNELGLVLL